MRFLFIFIFIFTFVSCELDLVGDESDDEFCQDQADTISFDYVSPNYHSFYSRPQTGKSCEELNSRKIVYNNERTCSGVINVSAELDSDSIHISESNTVIEGVLEEKTIVHNEHIYIQSEGSHILFYDQESTLLKASFDSSLEEIKMILSNELLIISGNKKTKPFLRFYDISSLKRIVLINELEFDEFINFSLRENKVFVKETIYGKNVPKRFSCEEIFYLGKGKGMNMTAFYDIDLDTYDVSRKKLYYGNLNLHVDLNDEFAYVNTHEKVYLENLSREVSTVLIGTIPNRFSLKEKDDHLILFTEKKLASNMTVLNKNLEYVYNMNGIAPGENIYSTRFAGERAYLVTFETVDPLFSFDISNVAEPILLDELKVPGFSRYMHVLGDGNLLTFGKSSGNWNSRVEINLYDTQDKLYKTSGLKLHGVTHLALFWDHHNIEFHKNFIFLKNYGEVIILKVNDREIREVGRIEISSPYGLAKGVLGFNNELRIFDNEVFKRYDLLKGLAEINE